MVTTGVPRKSAHCPHSAVKWPHCVRKKYGYEILGIFDHIYSLDSHLNSRSAVTKILEVLTGRHL